MGKYSEFKVTSSGIDFNEKYPDFRSAKHDYFRLPLPRAMIGLNKHGIWETINEKLKSKHHNVYG